MVQRKYKYKGEIISYKPESAAEDVKARYLIRTKGNNTLICLGLNPSTANKLNSDPTINKVEKFAEKNGFDSIAMINLYPLRNPKPQNLPENKNKKLYKQNLDVIKELLNSPEISKILIAIGEDVKLRKYLGESLKEIIKLANSKNVEWVCIGETANGYPKHPSRASYGTFVPYDINKLL